MSSKNTKKRAESNKPKYFNPSGLAPPISNSYSHVSRAGDYIFISAQQGRDRSGNLVPNDDDGTRRIRQAYRNLKSAIESQGGTLQDIVKMLIVTPLPQYLQVANKVQREEEFFGNNPIPPRTVIQANLPENDIFSIQADIYLPNAMPTPLPLPSRTRESISHRSEQQDSHNSHKVIRKYRNKKSISYPSHPRFEESDDEEEETKSYSGSNSDNDNDDSIIDEPNDRAICQCDNVECNRTLGPNPLANRRIITISTKELEKLLGKSIHIDSTTD